MSSAMIEQTAARLFADHVNRALLQECEGGHWPARLWGLVADNGLDLALAGEAAGGIGASWSDAYPILRGIGYWQAPLPLAETMVASLLLSLAGIDIPRGPITLFGQTTLSDFQVGCYLPVEESVRQLEQAKKISTEEMGKVTQGFSMPGMM